MAEPNVSPTVDEPEAIQPEGDTNEEVQELLAELKNMGVSSPADLQGMARASGEAGRLANMVGELRNEISELKNRPAPQQVTEYGEPQVDLGALVRNEISNAIADHTRRQTQAQQQIMREMAQIKSDPDFPAVQKIWDAHIANPTTQLKFQSGETTISGEYDKVVRSTYRNLLKRSQGVIENIGKMDTSKVNPPHIESGSTPPPLVYDDDEKAERIKKITQNRNGSDAELDSLISAFLPAGDPILRI